MGRARLSLIVRPMYLLKALVVLTDVSSFEDSFYRLESKPLIWLGKDHLEALFVLKYVRLEVIKDLFHDLVLNLVCD
jgi:hypothetical protein